MKKILKITFLLGAIAVVAGSMLAYANIKTLPIIQTAQKKATDKLLVKIASQADEFKEEKIEEGSLRYIYTALNDGKPMGYIYELNAFGFQSQIKFLIGIDTKGKYFGFQVIDQAETPGYGTKILTEKKYLEQFKSKSVSDEIDIIASSTITTDAVNKAIKQKAIPNFEKKK